MKKILFENIDGFKIIKGFSDCIVDPVATQKKCENLIDQSDEVKRFNLIVKEQGEHMKMQSQAKESYKFAEKNKNKIDMGKFENEWHYRQHEIDRCQEDIKKIVPLVEEKRRKIFTENAIFFDPTTNEIHVNDSEYENLKTLFLKNNIVDVSGKIISDYRGEWFELLEDDYIKHEIKTLNAIPNASWKNGKALSESQKDFIVEIDRKKRIAGLSDEERNTEVEQLKTIALNESINMRSRLEIQGDDQALEKSKAYYQERCAEIDATYAV